MMTSSLSETWVEKHMVGRDTGEEGDAGCVPPVNILHAPSTDAHDSSVNSEYSVNSRRPLVLPDDAEAVFAKAGLTRGDNSSISSQGECRVGQCRLPCLQPCATIATFTAMCCVLAMLNGALTAGYVNSVITTIEKRFEIGSSYSGLIAASVEIGGGMSVVIVSYFGSTRHIPNWIGFGALITGVGTLVFTLPHMMAPAYTITGGLNSSRHTDNTCRAERRGWDEDDDAGIRRESEKGEGGDDEWNCLSKESGQIGYVLTLVVAQMLIVLEALPSTLLALLTLITMYQR